jgi:hypothetical protein
LRVSIPVSACIPPLPICFPDPAPERGWSEIGAVHDTHPQPVAAYEPLNLLSDWISREQLAGELGLTSDTLARWEGAASRAAMHTHREKVPVPARIGAGLDQG